MLVEHDIAKDKD